jgi:hypothetical protein
LAGLKLSDLAPELPAIAEFSTNETMGHSADRLASRWGATRAAQDAFALRSHLNAAKAIKEGKIAQEIVPVHAPPKMTIVSYIFNFFLKGFLIIIFRFPRTILFVGIRRSRSFPSSTRPL